MALLKNISEGATKLASKATTFLKCLGPIMEVYGLISDIRDTERENDEARERKKARAEFYELLDKTKDNIRSVCEEQKLEFIKEVFDRRLDELEELQKHMTDENDANHEFNVELSNIEAEIKRIQDMILVSASELSGDE